MSSACPPPFIESVSFVDPVRLVAPLAPCLRWRYPSFARGRSCSWGISPCDGFRRSPWDIAVAPPISPSTGPGQSPRSWRPPLGAQVGVYCFYLRDFPHVSMAIVSYVSLNYACPSLKCPVGLCCLDTCRAE